MNETVKDALREKVFSVIFRTDTPSGRMFDLVLLALILMSVLAVMLETVDSVNSIFGAQLRWLEWMFTILFSAEYLLRLWCVKKPRGYAFSFFGVVDLIAVLPSYFSLLIPGAQVAIVVRMLRVVRVFRILKLVQYMGGTRVLVNAIKRSRFRIAVFLIAVSTVVTILGSFMYLIESPETGFTSIPKSVYWAIVTLTTVGYGDVTPATVPGQFMASILMLLGYALIAVPMGLIISESTRKTGSPTRIIRSKYDRNCTRCSDVKPDREVHFCSYCGRNLDQTEFGSI